MPLSISFGIKMLQFATSCWVRYDNKIIIFDTSKPRTSKIMNPFSISCRLFCTRKITLSWVNLIIYFHFFWKKRVKKIKKTSTWDIMDEFKVQNWYEESQTSDKSWNKLSKFINNNKPYLPFCHRWMANSDTNYDSDKLTEQELEQKLVWKTRSWNTFY